MGYQYDYKLTAQDSLRIRCDAPVGGSSESCGLPATTGQNDGSAPFGYRCDEHAQQRRTGHQPFPRVALPCKPPELSPKELNRLSDQTRNYLFEIERQLEYVRRIVDDTEGRLLRMSCAK